MILDRSVRFAYRFVVLFLCSRNSLFFSFPAFSDLPHFGSSFDVLSMSNNKVRKCVKVNKVRKCVINAFSLLRYISNDLIIITTCVAIAGCKITLRCSTVTIATPGGDEGGEMTVIGVEGDTVLSIPGVEYGILGAMGDGP